MPTASGVIVDSVAPARPPRKRRARSGSPPSNGLDRVLYVRADRALLDKLEELRLRRSAAQPGVVLSTSDVVRAVLWEAVSADD